MTEVRQGKNDERHLKCAREEAAVGTAIAAESRADFGRTGREFRRLFREAREAFPIPQDDRIQITLPDVVGLSLADGSVHWRMATDIYEPYSGTRPSEEKAGAFVKALPSI